MNPVDVLRGQIQSAVDGVKPGSLKRWVCCTSCQQAIELESTALPPAKCPSCNKEDPRWGTGVSKEAAESRALLMSGPSAASSAGGNTQTSSAPAETSSVVDGASSPGAAPGAASDAANSGTNPAPAKKTRSQRKAPPPAPTPPPMTQDATPTSGLDVDWGERRRQAVALLIEKYHLNKIEPVEVGAAVVATFGYTIWQDGLPVYRFMEPTDTAKSFKEEFLADKTEYAGIEIDVVRCHSMDNPDVVACCFKGNLVASTNAGRGTIRVTAGAKVRIGALATDKSVRFVVLY